MEFTIHTTSNFLSQSCHSRGCLVTKKGHSFLSRPRYIHRSSRRKFVYSGSTASTIPSLWTEERIGASRARHQNTAAPASSSSVARCGLQSTRNLSLLLPLQKRVVTSASTIPLRILLFNIQSLSNKSALMHDFIIDSGSDIFLTET